MRKKETFYGTTIIGERGQVVIPINARKDMGFSAGETLLAFSMGKDMLMLIKLSHVEKFASQLAKRLHSLRRAISKSSH